ncbi:MULTISPECIES: ABC transporter substrate-binding protein [unclassified Oceanispirochaeta]|uniref:ABC transporter substrate-binding protein n=1 Tax=unclassified Oceanispirochaeta TaxID=2635722 RepID=UPI000E09DE78|nr:MULTISPECIES: sugar ABC transporter substrate-binding protein [unclassified Oceanispirochaeta]MBF9018461.1 sugar ABC transporter substrate-binding protein [Oceanispirochaeta sp. M2]NPD74867.1 sugar ABC transporter substrate-binding protein [Oceanispirochaeta sp. M1]RDG29255.1 sugar ABC transporter substrate-binding protein [Oceanispirochaeta sp. M1]
MRKKMLIGFLLCATIISAVFSSGSQDTESKKVTALYFSATYADAAKEYVAEFKELTGIEVEIVDFPYLTLYEKMGLSLSTGDNTYDIMTPACQWDGEFEPFMEDLTPFIERDNWDSEDIQPGLWEQSGKWNNRIMGIPFANTPQTVSYRTDLIKDFPENWDEFFEVCETVHDPENGFYAISLPGLKEQFSTLWMMIQWSLGGSWADGDWNLTINSEESREALRIAKKWMEYADPASISWGLPEADAAFLAGNSAFCFSWPTLSIGPNGDNPEKSNVVGKWAISPIPYAKNGVTVLSSWDIGIPAASKNKDAAWEWIKFYTSKEKQLSNFVNYSILPSRESVWDKPEIKNSNLYPHKEASDRGSVIWWRIPAGTMAESTVRDAVANYITGEWDMEFAINYLEDGFEELLKEYPPAPGVKNTGR